MSTEPWLVRKLRPRAGNRAEPAGAGTRQRLVVCGDDQLALRLIQELLARYAADIVAILPNRRLNLGPRIARLPGVRVVESGELDIAAFRRARVDQADAVVLAEQDDVGNIHAALQAQEINPQVRLVIRMFNTRLGYSVRRLVPDCAVLSDAAMAAPAFVSAALGEVARVHVRLKGRTLLVAHRDEVPPDSVVCGLASGHPTDARPDVLPADPAAADLVLAVANGSRSVPEAERDPVDGTSGVPARGWRVHLASQRAGRARRVGRGRRRFATIRAFISPRLRLLTLILLGLFLAGTAALAFIQHDLGWADAGYVTVLTTLGGAEPDLDASGPVKVLQALLTMVSIALIPVVTAAVVEAVVNARLAMASGRLRAPIADHVVVAGLGNVGTRVIRQLHDLGVPVVAVDKSEGALGGQVARSLGIPLIVGDASREETLRAASVPTCQALVCLSTDDSSNLQAALLAQHLATDLRVVLRLFDGDFADRAQRAFGVTISRSVSYLAAPEFAAAAVERQVIGTIPINRRALLIAEVPVCAGSSVPGRTIGEVHRAGEAKVIAITPRGTKRAIWSPSDSHLVEVDDVLTVVATRTGLARMRTRTGDPLARDAAAAADPVPPAPGQRSAGGGEVAAGR